MNAYQTRHEIAHGVPRASTEAGWCGSVDARAREQRVGEILESKDLLNYFKKLERAFRRDVGKKREAGHAVESTSSLVSTTPRQNCVLEHPGLCQKFSRRHPRKIKAASNVRPATDFRIREGWSEGDIERLRKTETYRKGLSLPLFATDANKPDLANWECQDRTESRDAVAFRFILDRDERISIADIFPRMADDLNSLEILLCERLLSDERERDYGHEDAYSSIDIDGNFRFFERKDAERDGGFRSGTKRSAFPVNDGAKGFRGTSATTRNRVNARRGRRREGETGQRSEEERKEKPAPCQLVNTRCDGRRERFDHFRETEDTLKDRVDDCLRTEIVDAVRARARNGNGDRIGGGASQISHRRLNAGTLAEKDRRIVRSDKPAKRADESVRRIPHGGCDFSKETTTQQRATWNIDWRKRERRTRNAREARDDRNSSLGTSRARSCERATRSECARSTLHRFDSCCYVGSVRETGTSESDATCCSCSYRRAEFHPDADDSARQLETPTRCRKSASVRPASTVTPSRAVRLLESCSNRRTAATGRNQPRLSNRCCAESFRVPIVFDERNKTIGDSVDDSRHRRVAKPKDSTGKVHLKKVLVYPPRGQEGPPLTLYKSSSNIDCAVKGNPRVGYRYDVTYVQKFQSLAWCPDEISRE